MTTKGATQMMSQDYRRQGSFVKEVRGPQCVDGGIRVDIVAVSAVGADPIDTWRAGSSKSPWLEEELLEKLPLARVLYYDHFATRDSDLGSLANCLLEALIRKTSSDNAPVQVPTCPVIFLGHSTGGLVVKKALAFAWENHELYLGFARSCIGVAFFAVPHLGSRTLVDPDFVSTARKRVDDAFEYDIHRIDKAKRGKLIYSHPLPERLRSELETGQALQELSTTFSDFISSETPSQCSFSVWSLHETIPSVFEDPWYQQNPDDRQLLVSGDQPQFEQFSRATNISLPCDHYGTASFDTMHSREERDIGALAKDVAQDSRSSSKLNFLLQVQTRVSEFLWSSDDITMSLQVENFHFYKDDGDMLYTSKSMSLGKLLENESKFEDLLMVEIPKHMQPTTRKHAPVSTKYARVPVSVLKTSKSKTTPTGSNTGSKSTTVDDIQGRPSSSPVRQLSQSSSKSVRIAKERTIFGIAFESPRTSMDEIPRDHTRAKSPVQDHTQPNGKLKDSGSPSPYARLNHNIRRNSRVQFGDLVEPAPVTRVAQSSVPQCRWVHVPCNHILWTEKVISGIGAATDNDDHCEELLEEKHWEKKINFTTHGFPHARYIHSTCEFIGLDMGESSLPSELRGLLSGDGISVIEKLFNHIGDKKSPSNDKGRTDSLRKACSSARQILFMPYLHWEPFHHFQRREAIIHNRMQLETESQSQDRAQAKHQIESRTFETESLASQSRIEGQLLCNVPLFARLKRYFDSSPEMQLLWQYLGSDPLLHCRRTLDQYMYSTLPDTSARDHDQILYKSDGLDSDRRQGKETAERSDNRDRGPIDKKVEREEDKKRNVIVVEQLWMFVLNNGTLVTFFPPKEVQNDPTDPNSMFSSGTNLEPTSTMAAQLRAQGDLRACILKDFDEEVEFIESQWDIAALVVKHVITVFCSDTSPHIFSQFGKYIERLTEKQAQSWSKLHLRRGISLGGSSKEIQQIFQDYRDLRELKDVEDELRIIKKVLDKQKLHIETMRKTYKEAMGLGEARGFKYLEEAMSVLYRNQERINRMLDNVELTNKGYEELLSLQQNQITINEAVAAGEQSRAVTIFTVFTVLFLPLSFFASVFGMNVAEWSGTPTNVSIKLVLACMIPVSFVVIALTFLFAMNSHFRELARTAFELLLECFFIVTETVTSFPRISNRISRAWRWVKDRTISRLVSTLRAHKRRRLERKMMRFADSRVSIEKVARGRELGEKKTDVAAPSASAEGGRRRARWRGVFGSRSSMRDPVRATYGSTV